MDAMCSDRLLRKCTTPQRKATKDIGRMQHGTRGVDKVTLKEYPNALPAVHNLSLKEILGLQLLAELGKHVRPLRRCLGDWLRLILGYLWLLSCLLER